MQVLKILRNGCLIYFGVMLLISAVSYYFMYDVFFNSNDPLQKAEECVESLDFVAARKHLGEYNKELFGESGISEYNTTLEKICRAQVFHLIDNGEFILAKQIATEDGLPLVYIDALTAQLSQLYSKHDTLTLLNALSIVSFSGDQAEYDAQVHKYNSSLDQFCKTLYAVGKKEDTKAFLTMLKPDYNGSTAKINKIKSQYR